MTYVTINNETFTPVKAGTARYDEIVDRNNRYQYSDLTSAYNRPSDTKVYIYEQWRRFVHEIGGYGYRVSSRNSNIFTLVFQTDDQMFFITPAHNYVIEK